MVTNASSDEIESPQPEGMNKEQALKQIQDMIEREKPNGEKILNIKFTVESSIRYWNKTVKAESLSNEPGALTDAEQAELLKGKKSMTYAEFASKMLDLRPDHAYDVIRRTVDAARGTNAQLIKEAKK
jgi:hypothetical protein